MEGFRKMNAISSATQEAGIIALHGQAVLFDVTADIENEADPDNMGLFLRINAGASASRHLLPLGKLSGLRRFTCCYRTNLFFMNARAGSRTGSIPVETQYLLYQREDGQYVVLLPLLDGAFRCSLAGNADDDCLYLDAESGDPTVEAQCITGVYLVMGDDPYRLMEDAAKCAMARMRTGRLRREKALPDFIDKFGWCTWDAFYQEVSHEKVRAGLQSFVDGGVSPAFMILDDGWQSLRPGKDMRLSAFSANDKFPDGLAKTVSMAKEEFGLQRFLVWHTILGYWNGIDAASFPQYPSREVTQRFSPGIASYLTPEQAATIYIDGLVLPEAIHRFYQDFHRYLRLAGVDGVKVDCQAVLEVIAYELGGRVALMRTFHEALEGSVQAQLLGNLLNCMSCSSEMIYCALNSNITRSSTDYAPRDEKSHGTHLYFNAQASVWMGEFVHPDWDMFQSGHPWGAYHAAARAISGGPVYVSDKPDGHDFAVLRKVVLSDGSVPRPLIPARPTKDCLLHDPTT